ncbi:MAG: epoxyqueuosine reductase QueH [Lachnospiraceae bacterium]|nr:epoxyqueuosine reductase QueH [Lachnospiraceae bacterium]
MNHNYQKELDQIIKKHQEAGEKPSLLLHSCCAPCSSYVLEYLSQYFKITIYYYNPNITEEAEYYKRVREVKRLTDEMNLSEISVIEGEYEPSLFFEMAKKWPGEKEGGKRCYDCYRMRLFKTAFLAAKMGFDYFTTTLSISPHKNAGWLNELSVKAGEEFHVSCLPADFKKKNGYKRSIELSAIYDLYRQDYCGCIFSKREREEEKKKNTAKHLDF